MTKYINSSAFVSEAESGTSDRTQPDMSDIAPTLAGSGIIITCHKLNGQNYNQWSHSVMIFVTRKGKDEYLTGDALPPAQDDPRYHTWKTENNMVMSWLLNSMTNETGENFMYYKTAKEIWDAARDTYSNKYNASAIFEIKGMLHDLHQEERTLDVLDGISWSCATDAKQYKDIQEKEQIYKFLLGLNKNLDDVHGRVLSMKPLPKTSALAARRQPSSGYWGNQYNTNSHNNGQRPGNRPWCEHCKYPGHTKETCRKLPNKVQTGESYKSGVHVAATDRGPLNQEQMEAFQKMIQTTIQSAIGVTSTAAVA
ncbi:uncharacterized protein [Rutidosis leptorrhynchoides]|uniref:uncharacterized protein n=1 Tax=Rutidosis leptorrhynchoides TaxID=125765 RepID=UPI003A99011E